MATSGSFIQGIIEKNQEEQLKNLEKEKKIKLDFNPIAVYFGEDYQVTDRIKIRQPTVQDFIDYKEDDIYSVIAPFTVNPTSFRLQLWDMGVDWNKISTYELCGNLMKSINPEFSHLIFYDLDLTSFDLYKKTLENGEVVPMLFSKKLMMEIDENTLEKMRSYIQFMFNATPKEEEFCSSKQLKLDLINKDRQELIAKQMENKPENSMLSKISFCLNHPGFKYKKSELRNVGMVEFFDSIQRLNLYEATRALMTGSYSGFVDTSKINKEEFNFMRDLRSA